MLQVRLLPHNPREIKYEDAFISNAIFSHISKNSRTMTSPEVLLWTDQVNNKVRLPLFVKRKKSEGDEHYFIGDLLYIEGSAVATSMKVSGKKPAAVVNCKYNIDEPVEESLYRYLIN